MNKKIGGQNTKLSINEEYLLNLIRQHCNIPPLENEENKVEEE